MYSAEAQKTFQDATRRPTVDQMLELQKIGVVLAKDQQKLKDSSRVDNAHFFLSRQIDGFDFQANTDEEYYWSHRFTGRVARVGFRQWSMRIAESFWVDYARESKDGRSARVNDGGRVSYQFEWNQNEVTRAARDVHARILPPEDSNELSDEPDFILLDGYEVSAFREHFQTGLKHEGTPSSSPFSEPIKQAVRQMADLTSGDCDELANNMRDFGRASLINHYRSIGVTAVDSTRII